MHTKFQANPNRFDHLNVANFSAHSDFQWMTDSSNWDILQQIWIKLDANLFEYYQNIYIHSKHILNVISWSYSFKLTQTWLLIFKSIQSSHSKQHKHIFSIQTSHMHPNEFDQQEIYLWSSWSDFDRAKIVSGWIQLISGGPFATFERTVRYTVLLLNLSLQSLWWKHLLTGEPSASYPRTICAPIIRLSRIPMKFHKLNLILGSLLIDVSKQYKNSMKNHGNSLIIQ